MKPELRTFEMTDYPAVARLWIMTERGVLDEQELRDTLRFGPDLMVVATAGDQVIGVLLATFDGRRGWLHRLSVHPEHRRQGLATALVEELERRLVARGAPRINLLVMPDNHEGLHFWQRLGYLTHPDVLCTKDVPAQH